MINPTSPCNSLAPLSNESDPSSHNLYLILTAASIAALALLLYSQRIRRIYATNPNIRSHTYNIYHPSTVIAQSNWRRRQIHRFVGICVLPTNRSFPPISHHLRVREHNPKWKFHEVVFRCGETVIRGVEVEQVGLKTDRWIHFAGGRNGRITKKLLTPEPFRLLEQFQAHGILYDHAGVADSPGVLSCDDVVKAYRVVLHHLEKYHNARTIICYSHSMGGGIKALAVEQHEFDRDRTYLFITSRSYTSLDAVIAKTRGVFIASVVKWANWKIAVAAGASRLSELGIREIILQSAHPPAACLLSDSDQLYPYDDAIPRETTYAQYALEQQLPHKLIIGIPERHSEPLRVDTVAFIHAQVSSLLPR